MAISSFAIDNKIWDIYFTAEETQDWNYKQASDAISWYVRTGRACTDWLRAILKANPKKILAFMVSHAQNASTMGLIESATTYLRKYCAYKI